MPRITYAEHAYECHDDETLLECLSRHGVELPHSCRAGVCQTCMMQAIEGTPPPDCQAGLKPSLQQRGYFLACSCRPTQDLTIGLADDAALPQVSATVIDKAPLCDSILRLRLKPESTLDYHAGQFINLHRDDGLVRSYSLASLPQEGHLELHVERIPEGRMSGWLYDTLSVGDCVNIDGPHGDCFYVEAARQQNLLLVGTGSGLAPLWGILRDALAQGHEGEIHLFHGSRSADKLYLVDELTGLAQQHRNFFYTPCVSGPQNPGFAAGRANALALQQLPKLDGWRVYLCGHPDMVNDMRKKSFLAGASLNEIHADPFSFAE